MIKELSRWIETLSRYDLIYIGFSGGVDSTVLLHALANEPRLSKKIHVLHINHGISSQADAWQSHCEQICQQWSIPYQAIPVSFDRSANIEEGARNARYSAFARCIQDNQCLLTAHHQDDQAETLLLHLFRGAGVKGLAGISETSVFSQGTLHRPLLGISRETILAYAKSKQLVWIEDESNANVHFSRNFIRQQVLPLLQTKWPEVSKNLVRTSVLCREAQSNLDDLAQCDMLFSTNSTILPLHQLKQLSQRRLSNVLRYWLQINAVRLPNYLTIQRIIQEVIEAASDANPEVCWDNVIVRRFQNQLFLLINSDVDVPLSISWDSFPALISVPGVGVVAAQLVEKGFVFHPGDRVELRFRQGGELFYFHKQTKALKKLMQEWGIPTWLRDKTPLLYVNGQLAVVVGYAVSDGYYGEDINCCYELYTSAD